MQLLDSRQTAEFEMVEHIIRTPFHMFAPERLVPEVFCRLSADEQHDTCLSLLVLINCLREMVNVLWEVREPAWVRPNILHRVLQLSQLERQLDVCLTLNQAFAACVNDMISFDAKVMSWACLLM